jgi:hypothetical protein
VFPIEILWTKQRKATKEGGEEMLETLLLGHRLPAEARRLGRVGSVKYPDRAADITSEGQLRGVRINVNSARLPTLVARLILHYRRSMDF